MILLHNLSLLLQLVMGRMTPPNLSLFYVCTQRCNVAFWEEVGRMRTFYIRCTKKGKCSQGSYSDHAPLTTSTACPTSNFISLSFSFSVVFFLLHILYFKRSFFFLCFFIPFFLHPPIYKLSTAYQHLSIPSSSRLLAYHGLVASSRASQCCECE